MTHVVTESCIKCKYTDCVDVCPVDCFREGPNFLSIDPDECIDCAVCVAECPVNAIYAEEDVPGDQQAFIALNVELSPNWPSITKTKPSLPDADQWKDVTESFICSSAKPRATWADVARHAQKNAHPVLTVCERRPYNLFLF